MRSSGASCGRPRCRRPTPRTRRPRRRAGTSRRGCRPDACRRARPLRVNRLGTKWDPRPRGRVSKACSRSAGIPARAGWGVAWPPARYACRVTMSPELAARIPGQDHLRTGWTRARMIRAGAPRRKAKGDAAAARLAQIGARRVVSARAAATAIREVCVPGLAVLRGTPCVSPPPPLNPPHRTRRHAVGRNFHQHHRPASTLRDRDAVGRGRRLDPNPAAEGASIVQRRTEGPPGRSTLRSVDGGAEIRPGRFGSFAGKMGG